MKQSGVSARSDASRASADLALDCRHLRASKAFLSFLFEEKLSQSHVDLCTCGSLARFVLQLVYLPICLVWCASFASFTAVWRCVPEFYCCRAGLPLCEAL